MVTKRENVLPENADSGDPDGIDTPDIECEIANAEESHALNDSKAIMEPIFSTDVINHSSVEETREKAAYAIDSAISEPPRGTLRAKYENCIPSALQKAQFVLWRREPSKGRSKLTKMPYTVSKGKIVRFKTNDIEAALDFDEALDALSAPQFAEEHFEGIGIVLSLKPKFAGFVGIDIDHCFQTDGSLKPFAEKILKRLHGAYVERSVSGDGIHIIFFDQATGTLMKNRNNNIDENGTGFEMYNDVRYIALTGDKQDCSSDAINLDGISLYLQYVVLKVDINAVCRYERLPDPESPPHINIQQVLDIINKSKDAEYFNKLFNGELSIKDGDWSGCDFALCLKLCFYTGGNVQQIKEIWQMSKLAERQKFSRGGEEYQQRTINAAIQFWIATGAKAYKPSKAKRNADAMPTPAFNPAFNIALPSEFNYDITCPDEFYVDENGTHMLYERRGKIAEMLISHSVVLVRRNVINIDTGKVQRELACRINGEWIFTRPFENLTLSSGQKIIELSDYGIDVRSNTANYMSKWIADFIAANFRHIPLIQTVNLPGWQKDNSFLYPNSPECTYQLTEPLRAELNKVFTANGQQKQVIEFFKSFAQNDIAMLVIGAALAAPMIRLLDVQNIALLIYGESGCGKTTILNFAVSLFANVNENLTIPSAKSSSAGREAFFRKRPDFVSALDDISSVTDEREFAALCEMIYQFVNQTGKLKGTPDGGNQELAEFHGTLLVTGEQPITNETSRGGAKRRVLEVFVPKGFLETEQAIAVSECVKQNYGLFGRQWIKQLCNSDKSNLRGIINELRGGAERFTGLAKQFPHKVPLHIINVCVIALANALFTATVLKTESLDNALQIEYRRAEHIMTMLPDNNDIADWRRAQNLIIDWINMHPKYFATSTKTFICNAGENLPEFTADDECNKANTLYGTNYDNDDYIAVIPQAMKDCLQHYGFNSGIVKQLADNGFIRRHSNKNIAWLTPLNGNRRLMYRIPKSFFNRESETSSASDNAKQPALQNTATAADKQRDTRLHNNIKSKDIDRAWGVDINGKPVENEQADDAREVEIPF